MNQASVDSFTLSTSSSIFLYRWMQFLKDFALFPGEFFNAAGLLLQLFQYNVLAL